MKLTSPGIALAQLHSQAVDFNKSGVPAKMPSNLRPRRWPHFMEKKRAKSPYKSEKILGQLYDMVKLVDFVPEFTVPFDQRILFAHEVSEEILQQAAEIKEEYDKDIRRIMAQHDIDTEFEVWSTFVMSHNGERKDYSFSEELGHIMASIKGKYRAICIEKAGGDFFETLQPFVTAMYKVTANQVQGALEECGKIKLVEGNEVPLRTMDSKGMPLMSFPWLFDRELGKMASGNFYSRESVARQQGMQKRTIKRTHIPGLDTADAIETTEGFVTMGEVLTFKFQKDKALQNTVPEPLLPDEDSEHAKKIEAAIEGRRDEPICIEKQARPSREIADNYENLVDVGMEMGGIQESDESDEPLTPSESDESFSSLGKKDRGVAVENGTNNAIVEVNLDLGPKLSAYEQLAALIGDSDSEEELGE